MKSRTKNRIRNFSGILVSAICILLVSRGIKIDEFLDHLINVHPFSIILAILATTLSYIIRSWRWTYFFNKNAPTFFDSYKCTILGFFMNNILPARIGELVRAHIGGRVTKLSRSTVLATIAAERLADGLTISLFFIVFFNPFLIDQSGYGIKEFKYVSLFFIFATFLLGIFLKFQSNCFRLLEKINTLFSNRYILYANSRIISFIDGLVPLMSFKRLTILAFFSFIVWGVEFLVYYQVSTAFGVSLSLQKIVLFLVAVNFSSLIPAAPGGIGVIEAITTLVLVKIGIDNELALAMVTTQHLIQYLVVGAPGLFYFLKTFGGHIPESSDLEIDIEKNENSSANKAEEFQYDEKITYSIVIPAYNEEQRIAPTLDSILYYFENNSNSYEIIVVDDGSTDKTANLVLQYRDRFPQIKLLSYPKNQGKGYAVKFGVLNSKGKWVLINDADGATPIKEIERLETKIKDGERIIIGSRAIFSEHTNVKTTSHRKFLGRIFNNFVNMILLPGVRDTQCGFKLFYSPLAKQLFSLQTTKGFCFDCEVLFIAKKLGYNICETPINWNNIEGSKINLLTDSFKMFKEIIRFKLNDVCGRYEIQ